MRIFIIRKDWWTYFGVSLTHEILKTAENTWETRKGMGLKYKVILFQTKNFWWLFMTSFHHTEQHDRTQLVQLWANVFLA